MILAIGLLATIVSFLLAQTGSSGGDEWVRDVVTQVPSIGLFVWVWWSERTERRDKDKIILDWIERFGPALIDSTKAMDEFQKSVRDRARSRDDEILDAIHDFRRAADDLQRRRDQ